jgi:hypothetical protein
MQIATAPRRPERMKTMAAHAVRPSMRERRVWLGHRTDAKRRGNHGMSMDQG